MGWFKDFFFADREEAYEEVQVAKPKEQAPAQVQPIKIVPEPQPKQVAVRRSSQASTKQVREIHTKMVYQYPKGEFRFPLIPDQPRQAQNQVTIHSEPKRIVSPKNSVTQPAIEKKRPFKPTDVPSPVFAFQKRPSRFEFDVTKEQDVMEPSRDLVGEAIEIIQGNVLVETEPVVEEVAQPEPIVEMEEVIEEPESMEKVAIAEEVVAIEELQVEEIPEEIEQAQASERITLIHETPKAEEAPRERSTPPKTRIPFNVMMVNQDKQQQAKQETVKQEEVAEEKPATIAPVFQSNKTGDESTNGYYFPSLNLLKPPVFENEDAEWLEFQEELLNETLTNFNVSAKVVNVTQGPAVTRFEVQPEKGVKVSKITNLTDDIKLNLAAKDIRIEAPIPGKSTIGIEIPNETSRPVMLSEIMNSQAFQSSKSPLTAALGLDISGVPIVTDLQTMPHGLIAGATGSGKSVCINSLLISLLYKATPDELKLLLIDPKMVELAPYNRIPHLVSPVITDAKAATAALKWAVDEMERRYQLFSHAGVRNMEKFNEYSSHPEHSGEKLPYILIIIDELADLMMVAPNDVEEAISRIAQKARACGIHMIVATQRPSVDVITGLIKANIPTRVSFSVSSQIDSRTIIDTAGAEKLLGKGDMLFLPSGSSKPVRLQGTYVGDQEIDAVIAHVRNQAEPNYLFKQEELLEREIAKEEKDDLFDEACDFVLSQNGASTSLLQRHFRIGYNRAARLMESLEQHNIVSETNGSRPRDVIITREQLEKIRDI
ncbi:DNA translocase FtsK [Listeria booriae]|uniref:DNA translocase FtsK n=1 Tax=Listeria booriae TaxID=1552123 RepID=A0A7X0ZWT0_9LIST|nr:DNA translocase FtsK [Listeria booriae]MBC2283683.1 DNA translocase FtsK [Listeria booriae]MBC2293190.1 DNA translocase FtsK [Listeria booriae]MBC2305547.1 DNA translocase FtsK [Listeria booriae]MBC2311970.1 DNA translocase FtsK [Listeria booriae]